MSSIGIFSFCGIGVSASISCVFGILKTSNPPSSALGTCKICNQMLGIVLGAVKKSTKVVKKKVSSIKEHQNIPLDNSNSTTWNLIPRSINKSCFFILAASGRYAFAASEAVREFLFLWARATYSSSICSSSRSELSES